MRVAVEVSTDNGDLEEWAPLARDLRRELLSLDVERVTFAVDDESHPGARGSAGVPTTLVVALANSAVLTAVCQVLRSWVSRRRYRRVTIRYKDRSIEIVGQGDDNSQKLIDAFIAGMDQDRGEDQS